MKRRFVVKRLCCYVQQQQAATSAAAEIDSATSMVTATAKVAVENDVEVIFVCATLALE